MKTINLPWSKSITNRDLILASLCDWKTIIKWYLKSDDTNYMIEALKVIGIDIIETDSKLTINWWVNRINWNNQDIYVHQSWTCMRFLSWFSLLNNNWSIKIIWDERLMLRPMWDLINWIKQMWKIIESNWDFPPIKIYSWNFNNNKISMSWTSSSQFFTSLFHVWAFINWWLEINVIWELVSKPYIDLSIEELRKFWISVENNNYKKFIINEQKIVSPWILFVEWDTSALSYIANFSLLFKEDIKIENIWNRTKQWDYLYLWILEKYFWLQSEYCDDITIIKKSNSIKHDNLNYREINFDSMPDVSMSFMSIAPLLKWTTKVTWLQTLNLKECKRINAMWIELKKLWVSVIYDSNSMTIEEWFSPTWVIEIETYNDHRIAMVFGVLKLYLEKNYDVNIKILNPSCVDKTYPNFWRDLDNLITNI